MDQQKTYDTTLETLKTVGNVVDVSLELLQHATVLIMI